MYICNRYEPKADNLKDMESLYIQFGNTISEEEIPLLRGFFIRYFQDNVLFHNHLGENFSYSYPLVQYKRIGGRAGLLGLNSGAQILKELSVKENIPCVLGNRSLDLVVQSSFTAMHSIGFVESPVCYRLKNWLPLNQDNYSKYQQMYILSDKIRLLEKILTGNVLSFAKGVGLRLELTISCNLVDIESQYKVRYKDVDLTGFDVSFQCNVLLPQYIGLGKGVSMNHGVVYVLNA